MFIDVSQSSYDQLIKKYFCNSPETADWFLEIVPTPDDFRDLSIGDKKRLMTRDPNRVGALFCAAELGAVVVKSPRNIFGHAYSSQMVGRLFMDEYCGEVQESVTVLCTDVHNEIIARRQIFIGGSSQCSLYPDQVFRYALKHCASGVIIIHNHPSGNVEPSDNDLMMASRNERAGNTIGIRLVDFLIVGKDQYYSWREDMEDL